MEETLAHPVRACAPLEKERLSVLNQPEHFRRVLACAGFSFRSNHFVLTMIRAPKCMLPILMMVRTDKAYHSSAALAEAREVGVRTYIPKRKQTGRRNWRGKEAQKLAVYANRRRICGDYGKRLLKNAANWWNAASRIVTTRSGRPAASLLRVTSRTNPIPSLQPAPPPASLLYPKLGRTTAATGLLVRKTHHTDLRVARAGRDGCRNAGQSLGRCRENTRDSTLAA